jgi:hypothetical protein
MPIYTERLIEDLAALRCLAPDQRPKGNFHPSIELVMQAVEFGRLDDYSVLPILGLLNLAVEEGGYDPEDAATLRVLDAFLRGRQSILKNP